MVTPDELMALDLVIWLRTGQVAASRCHCNQSTISRKVDHALKTFGLSLQRRHGEWQLLGDTTLLGMERHIHQLYRFSGREPLRIEACFVPGPMLLNPPPLGWITGCFDHIGQVRPLELVEQRVIDAWITGSAFDLQGLEARGLVAFELNRAPVWLMADPDHPMQGDRNLSQSDLDRFPSLALPEGCWPTMESLLRQQGLWSNPLRLQKYEPAAWEGRTADRVTLSYATTLMDAHFPGLQQLDWDLGFENGDALVVRRDMAEQPAIAQLLELLRQRCLALQPRHPSLTVL